MRLFVAFFTLFFISSNNSIASSSTSGDVSVSIVPAINVSKSSDLNFGSISVDSTPGTVNQDGNTTGGVQIVNSENKSSAIFDVSGLGNASYNFTIPNTVTLTDSSSNTMTADLSFSSGNSSRSLEESGLELVVIDGTLNVGANQPTGNYSGTYNVNVAY